MFIYRWVVDPISYHINKKNFKLKLEYNFYDLRLNSKITKRSQTQILKKYILFKNRNLQLNCKSPAIFLCSKVQICVRTLIVNLNYIRS